MALTTVQSQTGKQADSRRRDSIRFPFLGPSLLYCDDVVAPSGRCQGLRRVHWVSEIRDHWTWKGGKRRKVPMFLRQDYVVNVFSWEYSVTPNWSHWRLLFSRLADWTSWRGFTVWFFRSWATWRRIFRVSSTSKRMLWQVPCLSCLWEEREHFLGKRSTKCLVKNLHSILGILGETVNWLAVILWSARAEVPWKLVFLEVSFCCCLLEICLFVRVSI